jgi:outer membrane protein
MKKFLFVLFTVICSNAFAQTKIGYVSVDEVFGAMPETKKADEDLAAFQKALQESYAQHEAELNAAYEKFVKDSAKLTPAVKEAKRQDLQTRISELQNKQTQLNGALEAEKEKQLKPIREKLMAAIKDVAKEMGYDHVLYKESAIVFPPTADLTNAVKKKLGIK